MISYALAKVRAEKKRPQAPFRKARPAQRRMTQKKPKSKRAACVDKLGVRIWLKNALDFHRPNWRIFASERPLPAARVAAPMRKLCALYKVGSRLQNLRALLSCSTKIDLFMGAPPGQQNRGPLVVPLTEINAKTALTGQQDSS